MAEIHWSEDKYSSVALIRPWKGTAGPDVGSSWCFDGARSSSYSTIWIMTGCFKTHHYTSTTSALFLQSELNKNKNQLHFIY